jgi:hypothetical protein
MCALRAALDQERRAAPQQDEIPLTATNDAAFFHRHPRESGNPGFYTFGYCPWLAAFTGMTLLATADGPPPLGFGIHASQCHHWSNTAEASRRDGEMPTRCVTAALVLMPVTTSCGLPGSP